MSPSTRRDFLRIAAAGSLAVTNSSLLWGKPAANKLLAWCTSKDRKFEEIKVPEWRAAPTESSTAVQPAIQIDASRQFQDILGFGAAFTDSSCFLFSQMAAKLRQALYSELFGDAAT